MVGMRARDEEARWGDSCADRRGSARCCVDEDEEDVFPGTLAPCLEGGNNIKLLGHGALEEEVAALIGGPRVT